MPTRCSSTRHGHRHREARPLTSAAACRTTCWTSGIPGMRRTSPRTSSWPARRSTRCWLRAAPGAGRGQRPVRAGGAGRLDFPGTDPRYARSWRRSWPKPAPPRCMRGWPPLIPQAAAAILPGNGRRIVRALEVIALTGSFTAQLPAPGGGVRRRPHRGRPPRSGRRVVERDAAHVGRRLRRGGRALAADGLREGRTAARALGYAQVLGGSTGCLRSGSLPRQRRCVHMPIHTPAAVVVPSRSPYPMAARSAEPRRIGPADRIGAGQLPPNDSSRRTGHR